MKMASRRTVVLAGTKLWARFAHTHRRTGALRRDMSEIVTDVWIL